MSGFVIEYNRKTGDRRVYTFEGPEAHKNALEYRFELEEQHVNDGWEIASLVSDSLETIKRTHSRYFQGQELVIS